MLVGLEILTALTISRERYGLYLRDLEPENTLGV